MKQNHYPTVRGIQYCPALLASKCGITLRAAQLRIALYKQSDRSDYQLRKLTKGMKP